MTVPVSHTPGISFEGFSTSDFFPSVYLKNLGRWAPTTIEDHLCISNVYEKIILSLKKHWDVIPHHENLRGAETIAREIDSLGLHYCTMVLSRLGQNNTDYLVAFCWSMYVHFCHH